MDIRDVQVRQGYLYVLCHETGVHVYSYRNGNIYGKVGAIPMTGGESFKINEQNTLLFVMGHSTDYWIKEVVITIFDNRVKYLENRSYQEKFPYYDVQFAKNFVLIVG